MVEAPEAREPPCPGRSSRSSMQRISMLCELATRPAARIDPSTSARRTLTVGMLPGRDRESRKVATTGPPTARTKARARSGARKLRLIRDEGVGRRSIIGARFPTTTRPYPARDISQTEARARVICTIPCPWPQSSLLDLPEDASTLTRQAQKSGCRFYLRIPDKPLPITCRPSSSACHHRRRPCPLVLSYPSPTWRPVCPRPRPPRRPP